MRAAPGDPVDGEVGLGGDLLAVVVGGDLDDGVGLGALGQGLDHGEDRRDAGLVADEQPPVGAGLDDVAAARPERQNLVAGLGLQRPAGARRGIAVQHDVDVDPLGGGIEAADGVMAPAEAALAVGQHHGQVLARLGLELAEIVGGQADAPHAGGDLRGVGDGEGPVLQAALLHHRDHVGGRRGGADSGVGHLGFFRSGGDQARSMVTAVVSSTSAIRRTCASSSGPCSIFSRMAVNTLAMARATGGG